MAAVLSGAEESPGSTKIRCRVTPGEGNLRESATENRPPGISMTGKGETVRQERTARTATDAARQTPPGARPNRDGTKLRLQAGFCAAIRVGREKRMVTCVPDEWSSRAGNRLDRTRLTGWLAIFL